MYTNTKKTWQKPFFHILAQSNVAGGGANPSYFEHTMVKTQTSPNKWHASANPYATADDAAFANLMS